MTILTIFLDNILAKYSLKLTKLRHLNFFSLGSIPPNLPNKRVASPHAAWRFAPFISPHVSKKKINPPPRNGILDTPLSSKLTS